MADVLFLQLNPDSPAKGYWDMTMLTDLLPESKPDPGGKAIIIIPGADQADLINDINSYLAQWSKCLVIVMSDEEAKFPINKLKHPNMTVWGSYMHNKYKVDRWLPIGYTPHIKNLPKKLPKKTLDWFFAGQITHADRENLVRVLETMPKGELVKSYGFAQGISPKKYVAKMLRAKYIPCPAGGVNIDSFRTYEALEAGCIPVVRGKVFWNRLFPDAPFPILDDWRQLPDIIKYADWDKNIAIVNIWWHNYKNNLKEELYQWTI